MAHIIPAGNLRFTTAIIKRENGAEIDRIDFVTTSKIPIPIPGSYFELNDNLDGKDLSGTVTEVLHKNAISSGPTFIGLVEVILE